MNIHAPNMLIQWRTSVPGQILHGRLLPGEDPWAAIDVEPGVAPSIQHGNHVLGDFAFFDKPSRGG